MKNKYYSYGIEINLLNVIIDHKFREKKKKTFPIVSFFRITRLGLLLEYILCHIGNDNIFSVRFSFEINYNFFLCCFPYGFPTESNKKNVAPPVCFFPPLSTHIAACYSLSLSVFLFRFLTLSIPLLAQVLASTSLWKKAQLLLITAIISSLLFTPKWQKKPERHQKKTFSSVFRCHELFHAVTFVSHLTVNRPKLKKFHYGRSNLIRFGGNEFANKSERLVIGKRF